jgi:indolepyruvate ferredoxin oxidoreductase
MADSLAGASNNEVALSESTLADKYDLGKQRALMTGTQAVVRLLLMQKEIDRRAGLNTAGLVTGYRGSPLGGVDAQMHRAKPYFDNNDILFAAKANTTGCSRFGTARARASIAAATCSATSISRALRALAARWR